jgi:hypothetical protein
MNDLLWLVNHPLWGNVVGIPTSQNPDTPEGLESQLSVRIHRIPSEFLHLTELEFGKLLWTQMDFGRASTLELLRGPPTSWEVLRPSEPRLSPSTLQQWTWQHYRGLNLTFFTLSARGSTGVFMGGVGGDLAEDWACEAHLLGQPTMILGQVATFSRSTTVSTLDTPLTNLLWHVVKTVFGNTPGHGWSTSPTLGRLGPCLVSHRPLVSYCLWTPLVLDIIKICMDFGPYGAFPSSNVPVMVYQQNSWNSLVISTYLLYLEWNLCMLVINICILWPPTPPHT